MERDAGKHLSSRGLSNLTTRHYCCLATQSGGCSVRKRVRVYRRITGSQSVLKYCQLNAIFFVFQIAVQGLRLFMHPRPLQKMDENFVYIFEEHHPRVLHMWSTQNPLGETGMLLRWWGCSPWRKTFFICDERLYLQKQMADPPLWFTWNKADHMLLFSELGGGGGDGGFNLNV